MKKILIIFLSLILVLSSCGCSHRLENKNNIYDNPEYYDDFVNDTIPPREEYMKRVWRWELTWIKNDGVPYTIYINSPYNSIRESHGVYSIYDTNWNLYSGFDISRRGRRIVPVDPD